MRAVVGGDVMFLKMKRTGSGSSIYPLTSLRLGSQITFGAFRRP